MKINPITTVHGNKREILDLKDFIYVYIPYTEEEKEKFTKLQTSDPCWRITVDKNGYPVNMSIC